MSTLFSAVNANSVRTWNGMRTNASSESPNVDLFFKWGASRGRFKELTGNLAAALSIDKDMTLRTLLWGRDVRQGAGERGLFRAAISWLAENSMLTEDEARRVMARIPELGRYDDLFAFVDTSLENDAFAILYNAIFVENNGLAAKWTPRKGPIANKFRKFLDISPKEYRKALVSRTNVVEQAMCAKDWENIDFSKIPSVAAGRYQKAFFKNASEKYTAYKNALVKGDLTVKINAGAVYPYDVIRSARVGDVDIASAQWKALPDFMDGSENAGILPIIDVSGSMTWVELAGAGKAAVTPLDVAMSLGMYISERNRGIFKDQFLTFDTHPQFIRLVGDLKSRLHQIQNASVGGSTNLHAVFNLILKSAVRESVPVEEMPKTILILSDMQFNSCVEHDDKAIEMITRKYKEAGYVRPNVVFWNINNGAGVPAKHDEKGTALISGFSPSIVKSLLSGQDMSPKTVMSATLMTERYNW